MKHIANFVVTLFILISIISCKTETKKEQKDIQSIDQVHKKKETDVHWSHQKGEEGPENWKNLSDKFSDCGGNAQSPINIRTNAISKVDTLVAIEFNYGKSDVTIINNKHTVQFNITGDNNVKLNGTDYKLLQFHYHTPSEHTIDGNHYPIEVHFVHKNSDTNFAVLGVLFKEGASNTLFDTYLENFPTSEGEFKSKDSIDLLSLFPNNKSYYNYKGSLTTPPCSEVVNWYVLKTPLTASKQQIEIFSKILNNNYRPVQSLNGREVHSYNQ